VVVGATVVAELLTCADGDPSPPHALRASANTNTPRRERRTILTPNEGIGARRRAITRKARPDRLIKLARQNATATGLRFSGSR
jgi:hypothetical protein